MTNPHISVRSAWNGWETAEVALADLEDAHWLRPPGAPRPLVHAFVTCDRFTGGWISHECGGTPHRLRVCVLRSHTAASAYSQLARQADERQGQQTMRRAGMVPGSSPGC